MSNNENINLTPTQTNKNNLNNIINFRPVYGDKNSSKHYEVAQLISDEENNPKIEITKIKSPETNSPEYLDLIKELKNSKIEKLQELSSSQLNSLNTQLAIKGFRDTHISPDGTISTTETLSKW